MYRLLQLSQSTQDDSEDTPVSVYVHNYAAAVVICCAQSHLHLFSMLQEQDDGQTTTPPLRPTEEWMLICQRNANLQPAMEDVD